MCVKFAEQKIELHLISNKVKRKMREKRPRISNYKNHSDRKEENVFDERQKENTEINEYKSLVKGKLPDIEIDELWQKDSYEQTGMTNYHMEPDIKHSDENKDWQIESAHDIKFLKDIYNTIDYDHSI